MKVKQVIRQCPVCLSFLVCYLMSCSLGPNPKLQEFIPGVYVRSIEHEFATGKDTLIVMLLEGGMYRIEKRSGFRRLHNGRQLPAEYKREIWNGMYDGKTGSVQVLQNGKLLCFDPDRNLLLMGETEYKKAK